MTNLEKVRNNIDDHLQFGKTVDIGKGSEAVYQLDNFNFQDLAVTVDGSAVSVATNKQLPKAGQVLLNATLDKTVVFTYKYAAFLDDEINEFLSDAEDSVTLASLMAIDQLLVSAAKRFDYRSGQKDLKVSQVFDQLLALRKQFAEAVESESNAGGVLIKDRIHPAYMLSAEPEIDISRTDFSA